MPIVIRKGAASSQPTRSRLAVRTPLKKNGRAAVRPNAWYVYVIELADAVGARRNPGRPSVYVGQSFHRPEVRFQQHKDGYKSSRIARRFAMRLMPNLYAGLNPCSTRDQALKREKELAAKLERLGYTVYGGH